MYVSLRVPTSTYEKVGSFKQWRKYFLRHCYPIYWFKSVQLPVSYRNRVQSREHSKQWMQKTRPFSSGGVTGILKSKKTGVFQPWISLCQNTRKLKLYGRFQHLFFSLVVAPACLRCISSKEMTHSLKPFLLSGNFRAATPRRLFRKPGLTLNFRNQFLIVVLHGNL